MRARMLGYAPLDTTITLGPIRSDLVLRIRPVALRLATVPITARRDHSKGCVQTGIPSAKDNPQLAALFDQLDANVERYTLLLEKYPFTYRRVETDRYQTSHMDDSLISVDTVTYDSRERRRYHVGSIIYTDTTMTGARRTMMYLPTFADLGDSAFHVAHCFAYRGQTKGEIRIDFRPADTIAVSDVEGSVYLDATRYIVRRAVFNLTKPKLVNRAIMGLTATTTFEEVLPLVPILAVTTTVQPRMSTRITSAEPHNAIDDPTVFENHPMVTQRTVEDDSVLDHTFIAAVVGGEPAATPAPPATAPPPKPVEIAIGCSMPPSFESADVTIYGIVGGAKARVASNDKLTLGIRKQFRLPNNLNLPVYGFTPDSKFAPTLTGQVTFTLGGGRLGQLALTVTSLLPSVDSALVTAVRRADSVKAFVGVPDGRYTMSLSSARPDAGALAIDLVHVAVPVLQMKQRASLDADAAAPLLPTGDGMFEFVVDEHGRVIPETLRTLKTSSPDFARAVAQGIWKVRYQPAMAGTCAVKQLVEQPFQAQLRVKEQ